MEETAAVGYALQLAETVGFLHGHAGLVHGDLKPMNVIPLPGICRRTCQNQSFRLSGNLRPLLPHRIDSPGVSAMCF